MKVQQNTKRESSNLLGSIFPKDTEKDKSILDKFPYKRCSENGILLDKENRLQRMLSIESTDLDGLNEAEKLEKMDGLTTIARVYTDDFKIITSTTRTNLTVQIEEKRNRLKEVRKAQMAGKNLQQLRKIERLLIEQINFLKKDELERPDLSFFFVIYADTENELELKTRQIRNAGSAFNMQPLNKKETMHVLYRLNNMNEE